MLKEMMDVIRKSEKIAETKKKITRQHRALELTMVGRPRPVITVQFNHKAFGELCFNLEMNDIQVDYHNVVVNNATAVNELVAAHPHYWTENKSDRAISDGVVYVRTEINGYKKQEQLRALLIGALSLRLGIVDSCGKNVKGHQLSHKLAQLNRILSKVNPDDIEIIARYNPDVIPAAQVPSVIRDAYEKQDEKFNSFISVVRTA